MRSHAKDAHRNETVKDAALRWYPRSWRARYGEELIALLDDEYGGDPPAMVRLGLVTSGLRQQVRQSGLVGDSVPPADGIRAGALLVLAGWAAFVVAGAGFAKFSEHFDEALPHTMSAHHVSDVAFTVLQTVAGVASIVVVVGALLVVPAFLRYLRGGGWTAVRGHLLRAVACSGVTIAVTVLLVLWAHRLTPQQRNGGLHSYAMMFLVWAALVVLTLALWATFAIVAGKRIELSRTVLQTEALLAVVVAVAMIVMTGATAVWWGAMAEHAPAFLTAGPAGIPRSPWNGWLVGMTVLMVAAVGAGTAGVVREARMWRKMRPG